jgi:hypothetical protein
MTYFFTQGNYPHTIYNQKVICYYVKKELCIMTRYLIINLLSVCTFSSLVCDYY